MARYYPISAAEFEAWAAAHGFVEAEPYKGERVFSRMVSPRQRVQIFTTLDVGHGTVRATAGESGRGRESIRVVGLFTGRDGGEHPVRLSDEKGKAAYRRRVFRVEGWSDNLAAAVEEVIAKVVGDRPAAPAAAAPRAPQRGAPPADAMAGLPDLEPPVAMSWPADPEAGFVEPTPAEQAGAVSPDAAELIIPRSAGEVDALNDAALLTLVLALSEILGVWQRSQGAGRQSVAELARQYDDDLHRFGSLSQGKRDYLRKLVSGALGGSLRWAFDALRRARGGSAAPPPEPLPRAPLPTDPLAELGGALPPADVVPQLDERQLVLTGLVLSGIFPGWQERRQYGDRVEDSRQAFFGRSLWPRVAAGTPLSEGQLKRARSDVRQGLTELERGAAAPSAPSAGPGPTAAPPRVGVRPEPVQVIAALAEPALEGLTAEQRAVVLHAGGPALIDAVAGSGKSSTSLRRMIALALSGQDMSRVLYTTFTRAAKADMVQKWQVKTAGMNLTPPEITTIHGLGLMLMKLANPGRRFAVDGETEESPQRAEEGQKPAQELYPQKLREALKERNIFETETVNEIRAAIDYYLAVLPGYSVKEADQLIASAEYRRYGTEPPVPLMAVRDEVERRVSAAGRITFGAMVQGALRALSGPQRFQLQGAFDHVIVDEAQDISPLMLALFFRLAGVGDVTSPQIMLVGDTIGQAIYAFQGGRPELVQAYKTAARTFPLTLNWRCAARVVQAAVRVLTRQPETAAPRPVPVRGRNAAVDFVVHPTAAAEAAAVAEDIAAAYDQAHRFGLNYRDMAVLYRMRLFSGLIQMELTQRDIPHVVERGEVFWNAGPPLIVANYLRLFRDAAEVAEDELARSGRRRRVQKMLLSVYNQPYRYTPAGFAEGLEVRLKQTLDLGHIFDADAWLADDGDIRAKLTPFARDREQYRSQLGRALHRLDNDFDTLSGALASPLKFVAAVGALQNAKYGVALAAPRPWVGGALGEDTLWTEAWAYLFEFARVFQGTTSDFLAVIDRAMAAAEHGKQLAKERALPPAKRALLRPGEPEPDYVTLTTAHSGKGREWQRVWSLGWVANVWPSARAVKERGDEGEAEERRLAYVAITRAMDQAHLSGYALAARADGTMVEVPPSPYALAAIGKIDLDPPATSPYADQYTAWVLAGCPAGQAPVVVRSKSE